MLRLNYFQLTEDLHLSANDSQNKYGQIVLSLKQQSPSISIKWSQTSGRSWKQSKIHAILNEVACDITIWIVSSRNDRQVKKLRSALRTQLSKFINGFNRWDREIIGMVFARSLIWLQTIQCSNLPVKTDGSCTSSFPGDWKHYEQPIRGLHPIKESNSFSCRLQHDTLVLWIRCTFMLEIPLSETIFRFRSQRMLLCRRNSRRRSCAEPFNMPSSFFDLKRAGTGKKVQQSWSPEAAQKSA